MGLAVPAIGFGADSHTEVYGRLNLSLENVSARGTHGDSDGDLLPRWRLQSTLSGLGLRGQQEISTSLKILWQIEAGISPIAINSSFLSARNTALGLEGDWGRVQAGFWDTPFKTALLFAEPYFASGVTYFDGLMDSPGFNTPSVNSQAVSTSSATLGAFGLAETRSFSRRQSQALQYFAPEWGGWRLAIMGSTNLERTSASSAGASGPDLLSVSLNYDQPAWQAGFAFEQHDDMRSFSPELPGLMTSANFTANSSGNTSTQDHGLKAGIGRRFGPTRVYGMISWLRYRNQPTHPSGGTAGDNSYSRLAGGAVLAHTLGDWTLRASGVAAGDGSCELATAGLSCDTAGFGAVQGTVLSLHQLSASTRAYAFLSKIWNRHNASYTFAINPFGNQPSPATTGQDPQAVGIGLVHEF